MTVINTGGPAFPQDLQGRRGDDPSLQGMTLRDWFAGQALGAMLQPHGDICDGYRAIVSSNAYATADAMLKAREAQS